MGVPTDLGARPTAARRANMTHRVSRRKRSGRVPSARPAHSAATDLAP